MIDQVKQLRVQIDGLAQLTQELKPIETLAEYSVVVGHNGTHNEWGKPIIQINSKEIDKAVDSFYLAKAWLGKILGELGNSSPYKSGYKTKEDIEPTSDVSKVIEALNKHPEIITTFEGLNWDESSHIEKVDHLRTQIQKLIENTTDFSKDFSEIELEQGFVYKYLCEARFWLGFELQRIKEEK